MLAQQPARRTRLAVACLLGDCLPSSSRPPPTFSFPSNLAGSKGCLRTIVRRRPSTSGRRRLAARASPLATLVTQAAAAAAREPAGRQPAAAPVDKCPSYKSFSSISRVSRPITCGCSRAGASAEAKVAFLKADSASNDPACDSRNSSQSPLLPCWILNPDLRLDTLLLHCSADQLLLLTQRTRALDSGTDALGYVPPLLAGASSCQARSSSSVGSASDVCSQTPCMTPAVRTINAMRFQQYDGRGGRSSRTVNKRSKAGELSPTRSRKRYWRH